MGWVVLGKGVWEDGGGKGRQMGRVFKSELQMLVLVGFFFLRSFFVMFLRMGRGTVGTCGGIYKYIFQF